MTKRDSSKQQLPKDLQHYTAVPQYAVGRNDGSGCVFYFKTLAEAEAKIAEFEGICPADVHNGLFYIDTPEE